MNGRVNKTVLLSIAFAIAVIGLVVYTTMGNARYRCEVCVAYRLPDGTETRDFPAHQSDFHHAAPVFETVPGWAEPLDECATQDDLPEAARCYVELVERELGAAVELVGTGAAREQVLARS